MERIMAGIIRKSGAAAGRKLVFPRGGRRIGTLGVCLILLHAGGCDEVPGPPPDPFLQAGNEVQAGGAAPREAAPLSLSDLPAWLRNGKRRFLVDLREPRAFARGHLEGAVNLQEGYGQFELRARRFFGNGAGLCLAAADPERAEALARRHSGRFEEMRWLKEEAPSEGAGVRSQKTIGPEAAWALLRKGRAVLFDARTSAEYGEGHVPAAVFVYPDDFPRLVPALRKDPTFLVVCEEGWRSSLLVSWLDAHGFTDARNLIGGMKAWRRARLPVERGADQRAFR